MVPFGISVGDFLGVVALAHKVGNALKDSRGSAYEINTVVRLLSSVAAAVEESRAIFVAAEASVGVSSPSVLNGIVTETLICREIMDDFMKRSKSYTDSLVNGRGSRAKKEWKKVTWCLFHDKDIQRLEGGLQCHLVALCMYNVAHARVAIAGNAQSISRIEQLFDTRWGTISTRIDSLNMLPKQLGWVWEGGSGPLDAPVRLFDAFGKMELIPLVFFSSAKMFRDILKVLYRDTLARLRIMRNQYTITNEDADGQILDLTNWSNAVKPGMQVSLNVIFKAASCWNARGCPRCKSQILEYVGGETRPNRLTRCQSCQLRYRVRTIEVEPTAHRQIISSRVETAESTSAKCSIQDRTSPNIPRVPNPSPSGRGSEEHMFQRVHYFREVLKLPTKVSANAAAADAHQNGSSPDEDEGPIRECNVDVWPSIHRAAAEGNVDDLISLLRSGADVNKAMSFSGRFMMPNINCSSFEIHQFTPLHVAALFGQAEAARYLLDKGASVNATNGLYEQHTAIHYACLSKSATLAKLLVQRGASLHGSRFWRNVFHSSCCRDPDTTLIHMFLREGVDVNQVDERLGPPLLMAVQSDCLEAASALLAAGADVNRSLCGWTSLMRASWYGLEDMMELLLKNGAETDLQEDEYGYTALHKAAQTDNIHAVRLLIKYGAALDVQDGLGFTALLLAALFRQYEIEEILLAAGADPDIKDHELGLTPLMWAAQENQAELAALLLSKRPSLNDQSTLQGKTALVIAATCGHQMIAEYLLSAGADTEITTKTLGYNALMSAASEGHCAIVCLLIEHGVSLACEAGDGTTPLIFAASGGHTDTVRLLVAVNLGEARINAQDNDGWTALHTAAFQGHDDVVKILLEHGALAEISCAAGDGRTPLMFAARRGHTDTVRLLVAVNLGEARINAQDNDGWTALHKAAFQGHDDVVKILLEHGALAEISCAAGDGRTPLMFAARRGHTVTVRLLVAANFDEARVNAQDSEGWTALHAAAWFGSASIVTELISNGADPTTTTKWGNTALMLALLQGHASVVKQLLGVTPNLTAENDVVETALFQAAVKGQDDVVKTLLEHGVSAEIPSKDGWLPLPVAAFSGHAAVVAQLLSKGVNVDSQNRNGWTALHWASAKGHEAIVQLLLSHNADTGIIRKTNQTALTIAVIYNFLPVVKLLVRAGVEIEWQCEDCKTALEIACTKGNVDIAAMLIQHGACVDGRRFDGWTPLLYAACFGGQQVVRLLLDHGAAVNLERQGSTALMLAVAGGDEDTARLLVSHGADVNICDRDEDSPLILAALYDSGPLVELLAASGSDMSHRDQFGDNALDVAATYGCPQAVEVLLFNDAEVNRAGDSGLTPLGSAVVAWAVKSTTGKTHLADEPETGQDLEETHERYINTIKALLDWDAEPNVVDPFGRMIGHYAAHCGDEAILQVLLDSGLDPDMPDRDRGWTALHYSAAAGKDGCTGLLLGSGADPDAKTYHDESYHELRRQWAEDTDCERIDSMVLGEYLSWVSEDWVEEQSLPD